MGGGGGSGMRRSDGSTSPVIGIGGARGGGGGFGGALGEPGWGLSPREKRRRGPEPTGGEIPTSALTAPP